MKMKFKDPDNLKLARSKEFNTSPIFLRESQCILDFMIKCVENWQQNILFEDVIGVFGSLLETNE
uniref:Uncharacterized protein n=1 Tax=Rhizophora mucronata TaxID=61149 RepID=A0A2P2KSF8_RHIMU